MILKIKTNIKLLFSSIISSSLLFSCSEKNLFSKNLIETEVSFSNANINNYSIKETKKNNFTFDLGVKNGAFFSVVVNSDINKAFSIKNSSNGFTGKRSDIKLLRIYLVDINSTDLTSGNLKAGPFDIDASSTGPSGTFFTSVTGTTGLTDTGTLSFKNVANGTFYLAIAAYNSTTVIDSSTNLTSVASGTSNTSRNITSGVSLGRFAISGTGGDSAGSVAISKEVVSGKAQYTLVGTTALGVTLTLADVFVATIDSNTTITDGSYTIPNITLQ